MSNTIKDLINLVKELLIIYHKIIRLQIRSKRLIRLIDSNIVALNSAAGNDN